MPRQSKPLDIGFVLVVAVLISPYTRLADAQDSRPSISPCYAQLSRAQLVSAGTGWAIVDQPSSRPQNPRSIIQECTDQHLYWTEDDGKSWREIGPAIMPTRGMGTDFFSPATSVQTVFFLDKSHGWMISTDALNGDADARFYFLSTADGGKSWRTLVMQRAPYKLMDDFWPTQVYFSDASHGWILWHWAVMHGQLDALLATVDGGRTWRRLPDPPGAGPIDFVSPSDGWMIGGSPNQGDLFVAENDMLWGTHDGGLNWTPVRVPVPPDGGNKVIFSDVKLYDRNHGVVTASTSLSDYAQRFFSWVTQDGGISWHVSQFEAFGATPSLVRSRVIWTILHRADTQGTTFDWKSTPKTLRIGNDELAPQIPESLSLEGMLNAVEFIDGTHGWATYINGRPGVTGIPGLLLTPLELLSTADGGRTFRVITPRAANDHPTPAPELYVVNGSVIRFPPLPPIARRPPPIVPNNRHNSRCLFSFAAGGPTMMIGSGFQRENTVWIGAHRLQVPSSDGRNLQFLIPFDIAPGTYTLYVETSHGKTNETEISIGPQETLVISNINNGQPIHPGQEIFLVGSGLLLENRVWFGSQSVPSELVISGAPTLRVTVPASVPPGACEVYVSNASGKSKVVSVTVE